MEIYREFIEEASKCYADALQHDKPDISALVGIYAKIARMRVLSSPKAVENAERIGRQTELLSHASLSTTQVYTGI